MDLDDGRNGAFNQLASGRFLVNEFGEFSVEFGEIMPPFMQVAEQG
jgi:hypothetical protein